MRRTPSGFSAFVFDGEREGTGLAVASRTGPLAVYRRIAAAPQLPVVGALGVLIAAKEAGFIREVRPHVDRLAGRRFFISDDLYAFEGWTPPST